MTENNQDNNKNIFVQFLDWCKSSFLPLTILSVIILILLCLYFLAPQKRIFENGQMAGKGEFKSASVTMIDKDNYLLIDGQCGTRQPEIYNWKENKFYKTKNKIPNEYIPWYHSSLKLKNGNILLVANNHFITKDGDKNFVLIFDTNNQTFTPYENTDLSKLYLSVDFSKFLSLDNGNILLFNKNDKKSTTEVFYFNSKDFSLINSDIIDNFELFEAKQINENEIILYGKNSRNYIYNLKDNSCKISEEYKHINPKLQALKESNYPLGWEKPIYLSNGDIVFFDTFMNGKKIKPNMVYSKNENKLVRINDFKYPREDFSTILLPNDTILIFGGTCGNSASQNPFNVVEIYKK